MEIRPNYRWNNIIHNILFYSGIIGFVIGLIIVLSGQIDTYYKYIILWLLFEIFLALVVILHLIEIKLIIK